MSGKGNDANQSPNRSKQKTNNQPISIDLNRSHPLPYLLLYLKYIKRIWALSLNTSWFRLFFVRFCTLTFSVLHDNKSGKWNGHLSVVYPQQLYALCHDYFLLCFSSIRVHRLFILFSPPAPRGLRWIECVNLHDHLAGLHPQHI